MTLPPSGARSFFTRYNYALIFVLNVCLMSLVSMTAQRDLILNDGFVNPVAKKRFLDQLFLSITSYPLGAWHAAEDLRGVPSSRGALGGDWTFASMLLFPLCILLILESIRLLLSAMTRRGAGTGTKRSIFRIIIVSAGGSVAAALLGLQIWVDVGGNVAHAQKTDLAPPPVSQGSSVPWASLFKAPTIQIAVLGRPGRTPTPTPRKFDWTTTSKPWLSYRNRDDFKIPPGEEKIALKSRYNSAVVRVKPTEVGKIIDVCVFEQEELDAMDRRAVIAEVGKSWKAIITSPDLLLEIIPAHLIPPPPDPWNRDHKPRDLFDLPSGFLDWFRHCHLRRLAMFRGVAAPAADDVATYLADEELDSLALSV